MWLRDHPFLSIDDASKAPFLAAPTVVLTVWRDEFHWVVYYLGNAETMSHSGGQDMIIANIGEATEPPSVYRS